METPRDPTTQHAKKCPKLYGRDCKCDGYHTFDELYDHRIALFIKLCQYLLMDDSNYSGVWRSKIHHDGSSFDGWFIMGIGGRTPEECQQITYHLPNSRWDETDFAETLEKAPEWDGHTSDDVITRLKQL